MVLSSQNLSTNLNEVCFVSPDSFSDAILCTKDKKEFLKNVACAAIKNKIQLRRFSYFQSISLNKADS